MAARITLPFWPTSLNNLSWSSDNIIAVGGGKDIAILIPRLRSAGPNDSLWDVVILQVNAFTAREVPLADPMSFCNFSVGEELSQRHVHALGWSNTGLAKYGGCALAVLSSNHVLSLWECKGKPTAQGKWTRQVIVNHTVRAFYEQLKPLGDGPSLEKREEAQVRQRILAFAWSPPVRKSYALDAGLTNHIGSNQHFLAVSTEAEDVLILRVQSPHDVLSPDRTDWTLTVVHCFNVRATVQSSTHQLKDRVGPESDVDHTSADVLIAETLAWGPYNKHLPGKAELAFTTKGRLFCVPIDVDFDDSLDKNIDGPKASSNGAERWLLITRSDISGPIKFASQAGQLLVFGTDTIFSIDLRQKISGVSSLDEGASDINATEHHLDRRWDEISGVAVSSNGSHLLVNITFHMSTASAETTALRLPFDSTVTASSLYWQQAIVETKATYSAEHDLAGHVQERTWGIAASPLGNYIATCTSLVPSDAIAHIIHSSQNCVINVTKGTDLVEGDLTLAHNDISSPGEVPAGTLLFSLQRKLERAGDCDDEPPSIETVTQALLEAKGLLQYDFARIDGHWQSPSFEIPELLVHCLRLKIYMRSNMLQHRLRNLAELASSGSAKSLQLPADGYRNLVDAVLDLPQHLSDRGGFSGKLRSVYQVAKDRLEARETRRNGDGEGVVVRAAETEQFRESCSICQLSVPFESLIWARCAVGHQFPRCSLTFLPIQEPGISKFCEICNSQVLNEGALAEFAPVAGEDIEMVELPAGQTPDGSTNEQWVQIIQKATFNREPPSSLARLLFAACDTCILCGGKFVA